MIDAKALHRDLIIDGINSLLSDGRLRVRLGAEKKPLITRELSERGFTNKT